MTQLRVLLDELQKIELEVGHAGKAVEHKAGLDAKKVEALKKVKEIFAD